MSGGRFWRAWPPEEWTAYLAEGEPDVEDAIRRATHRGRPIGCDVFVEKLEKRLDRPLASSLGGRPRKTFQNVPPDTGF